MVENIAFLYSIAVTSTTYSGYNALIDSDPPTQSLLAAIIDNIAPIIRWPKSTQDRNISEVKRKTRITRNFRGSGFRQRIETSLFFICILNLLILKLRK